MNDGKSPIVLQGKNYADKFEDAWSQLVPSSGAAACMQGEIVRVIGKISHEILDNGGVNWDADFRKMTNALKEYFKAGESLETNELKQALNLIGQISLNSDNDIFEELGKFAVKFIERNPIPIPLNTTAYKR
ncbi:MAG: hypothetical protein LUC34_00015 [Campylobacter sp.]|nr:hypothetical protein [Campylobacter sp.]